MRDKRDTPLVNLSESAYLDQLKKRAINSDPFGMLHEGMPGRQKKPLPPEGSVEEEKEKDV